jgi:LPS-assembly lipoprotein
MPRARRRCLGALGALLLPAAGVPALSGCGFQLRGTPALPFRRIALTGFAPRSPMAEALRRALGPGVEVMDATSGASRPEVVLAATTDGREKSATVSTVAGQVREFQLRVRLAFRVLGADGRERLGPAELVLVRDLSYSETLALAKAQEEAQMFREMEADIAQQVLRRLSAVQP